MRALLLAAAILASSAHAGEPPRFDARATLQRAQVGTYSPRAAAPVKVRVETARRPARASDRFERMTCRENPAEPHTLICETKRTP